MLADTPCGFPLFLVTARPRPTIKIRIRSILRLRTHLLDPGIHTSTIQALIYLPLLARLIMCTLRNVLVFLVCLKIASSEWICYETSLVDLQDDLNFTIREQKCLNNNFIENFIKTTLFFFFPFNVANQYVNDSACGKSCVGGKTGVSDEILGYIGVIIAVIFFGTNFLPVKKFDTGDGLFFQWVLCIGIWLVGLTVNLIRKQPPFFYPSLIGGFLWTFGKNPNKHNYYTSIIITV